MYNQGMSETETIPLPDLDIPKKIKLSVPLLTTYLTKGYQIPQIANICNVSRQAIHDYINRHTELQPLLESDGYMAHKCKAVAGKALGIMDRVLDEDFSKKDLVSLNIMTGTLIDKYRLLSDQSTQNIAVDASLRDVHQQLFKQVVKNAPDNAIPVEPDDS